MTVWELKSCGVGWGIQNVGKYTEYGIHGWGNSQTCLKGSSI